METSKKFEAENGTMFVVEGEQVTILRADQPEWKGLLADVVEFVSHISTKGVIDLYRIVNAINLHQAKPLSDDVLKQVFTDCLKAERRARLMVV